MGFLTSALAITPKALTHSSYFFAHLPEARWHIDVTSFSVFHAEATVSIGLKNVHRMVTSILQN